MPGLLCQSSVDQDVLRLHTVSSCDGRSSRPLYNVLKPMVVDQYLFFIHLCLEICLLRPLQQVAKHRSVRYRFAFVDRFFKCFFILVLRCSCFCAFTRRLCSRRSSLLARFFVNTSFLPFTKRRDLPRPPPSSPSSSLHLHRIVLVDGGVSEAKHAADMVLPAVAIIPGLLTIAAGMFVALLWSSNDGVRVDVVVLSSDCNSILPFFQLGHNFCEPCLLCRHAF